MKLELFILSVCMYSYVKCQTVCSLDELMKELKEDINDNGQLDCLRKINPKYSFKIGLRKKIILKWENLD